MADRDWRTDPAFEIPGDFGQSWIVINDALASGDGPYLVADVHTCIEDARLIAAAPALLEACEAVERFYAAVHGTALEPLTDEQKAEYVEMNLAATKLCVAAAKQARGEA